MDNPDSETIGKKIQNLIGKTIRAKIRTRKTDKEASVYASGEIVSIEYSQAANNPRPFSITLKMSNDKMISYQTEELP